MEPRPRFADPATSPSNGGAAHAASKSANGAANGKRASSATASSASASTATGPACGDPACEPSLVAAAGRFLEDLVVAGAALVEVYADRFKLAMRRKIVAIALAAAGAVCALFLLASASLAVLRGACGGFAELFGGRAWAGDLAGGLVVLGLIGGAAAVGLRVSSRRELRRLEEKYEQIRNQRQQRDEARAQTDDA